MTLDANGLRSAFTRFFIDRAHAALPPASLIPHDPSVMFTIAGMVQFKPYFTGEEPAPVERATTIQPCFRMVDIDLIGSTSRHNTFFEMLGNFSFGDYFKQAAIPFAWEFLTETLGLEPDRLWVTIHESDTDASGIWQEVAHLPADRIQKMGEDNFWKMGDVGPCGPCSEIYFDRGEAFGEAGGPAHGGEERYVEIWNLVFMQYERDAAGNLLELPKKNIDTGAGLERMLSCMQGVPSVFDTDVYIPLIERAAKLVGIVPGRDPKHEVALRILSDHARAMTMLVSDGVFPSNEGRGYVLRRIIRRAVLRAQQFGASDLVMPELVGEVVTILKDTYPKLARDQSFIETVVAHEEEAFGRTLRAGSTLLEEEFRRGTSISGEVAFRLHDTFGFPIDLTAEIAEERGVEVDRAGFESAMEQQRERARGAERHANAGDGEASASYRELFDQFGPTRFIGYEENNSSARVLSIRERANKGEFTNLDGEPLPENHVLFEIVLDHTPFYAESGGQVGDTGMLTAASGVFRVLDTKSVFEKVTGHIGYFVDGEFEVGEEVAAAIDVERRESIRRNHTATHLLHHALRNVLGEHVRQQGSLVAPDRLRFDFSHFAPLSAKEIEAISDQVNAEVLTNHPVRIYETSKKDADAAGVIAFFGDKYGDVVRVVESGSESVELCGGTHVSAVGQIGLFRIVSEASIGANTRRIEATTGTRSLADVKAMATTLNHAAELLRTTAAEVDESLERLVERQRELEDDLRSLKSSQLQEEATTLRNAQVDGVVLARRDGLDANALRELALSVRNDPDIEVVGLIGAVDENRVALVVASTKASGLDAKATASEVARIVGGGGGGSPELATAGGRDVAAIGDAFERLGVLVGAR